MEEADAAFAVVCKLASGSAVPKVEIFAFDRSEAWKVDIAPLPARITRAAHGDVLSYHRA